jgi:hypothetical protein
MLLLKNFSALEHQESTFILNAGSVSLETKLEKHLRIMSPGYWPVLQIDHLTFYEQPL